MAKQTEPDPFLDVFKETVPESYASIIEDYDFSVSFEPSWKGSFEMNSDVCIITIRLERDNSINCNIKPARRDQVPKAQYYNTVDLTALINFMDPEADFEYQTIRTPERLQEEVERLAKATRQYCTPMMEGDLTEWVEFRKIELKYFGLPI